MSVSQTFILKRVITDLVFLYLAYFYNSAEIVLWLRGKFWQQRCEWTLHKIGSKAVCKFHIYGAPRLPVPSIAPSRARSSDAATANLYVLRYGSLQSMHRICGGICPLWLTIPDVQSSSILS